MASYINRKRALLILTVFSLGVAGVAWGAVDRTQIHHRWRNDDGSESAATFRALTDTPVTGIAQGDRLRLRFEISNEGGETSTVDFIKRVQRGTQSLGSGQTRVAVNLGSTVDTTKTFVWSGQNHGGGRASSSNPWDSRIGYDLESSSVLALERLGAPGGATAEWQVVEFVDGISVQRGMKTLDTSDSTVTVTLPVAVDPSRSFVLGSVAVNTSDNEGDAQWTIRHRLLDSTTLEFSRNGTGVRADVYWQVVEMDGVSVQRGIATKPAGQSTITQTITPIATSSSFLLMSYKYTDPGPDGDEGNFLTRGKITSSSTIQFNTRTSGNSVYIAWEVITFYNASVVTGSTAFTGSGDRVVDVTIPSVDTLRSFVYLSIDAGTGSNPDGLDDGSWTGYLTSPTNLRLERNGGGSTASTVDWQVVQFSTTTTKIARLVPRLEYGRKSTTCGAIATSSWVTVPHGGGTEHWKMSNSPYLTNGEVTTNVGVDGGITDEEPTFVAGAAHDTHNDAGTIAFLSNEFTEVEYSIEATNNATPGAYCFRITDDGALLEAYPAVAYAVAAFGSSASGTLTSAIFDTGSLLGAQLNSVLWHGDFPAGTAVGFQFATANASSGPWSYRGPDGTANTQYEVVPSTSLPLQYGLHGGQRFFRYRVIMNSNDARTETPRIDDVVISWSP